MDVESALPAGYFALRAVLPYTNRGLRIPWHATVTYRLRFAFRSCAEALVQLEPRPLPDLKTAPSGLLPCA